MHSNDRFHPVLHMLEDRSLLSSNVSMLDVTTIDFKAFDLHYSITGGDVPSLAFRAYLSADEHLDSRDVLLPGEFQVTRPEDLTQGAPHQATMTLPAPAPIHEGQRYVIVVADPDNVVEPAGSPTRADNALFAVPLLVNGQTADRNGRDNTPEAIPSAAGSFTGAILRGTEDFARLAAVDLSLVWTGSSRLQFGNTQGEPQQWQRNEDLFAQKTVIPPLTELVHLISADLARVPGLWGDAVFSINDAYDSLRQHVVPESLHYEGRALDLDVMGSPPGGAELARLAGLTWLAGFDWVYFENDHIHASEHAAFATTIDQQSLQQSLVNAFQLGRIDSRPTTESLVHSLDGFDKSLKDGRAFQALSQLFVFRTKVVAAIGTTIRDTGFGQLLLLNVDVLIGRIQSILPALPTGPTGKRAHTAHGTGHFVSANEFVAAGIATHLGRFEEVGSVRVSPTENPALFRVDGWAIDTAANGDMLFEVFSGRLNAVTGTITATVAYIGGTGRFAGAHGVGDLSAQLLPDGSIAFAVAGSIDFGNGLPHSGRPGHPMCVPLASTATTPSPAFPDSSTSKFATAATTRTSSASTRSCRG